MTKEQIRHLMRKTSSHHTKEQREAAAQRLFARIEQSSIFAISRTIALYCALPDEVPTRATIERWGSLGRQIVVPRITSASTMEFYPYDAQQMQRGAFGIDEPTGDTPIEPSAIDLTIVPGVAFCAEGSRLGRGAGYYDRYLSRQGYAAYNISICLPHQLLPSLPCAPHDQTMDWVVCEDKVGCDEEIPTTATIISRVLEAAGVDANRLGCGIDRLNAMGLSWVLLRYSMVVDRAPQRGEEIVIETWISSCSRIASTREFILRSRSGEQIGVASTQWAMIDLESRHAVNLIESELNYSQFVSDRPTTLSVVRRLPESNCPTIDFEHCVDSADIDFNRHVNTLRYVELMLAAQPIELRRHIASSRVDLHFASESRLGDTLSIEHTMLDEDSAKGEKRGLFAIRRSDGTLSASGVFGWL
ncbi:MAG: 5-formyltetrahydrofolate cyclo-ligase [Rikenellaceae bacterium]